MVLERGLPCEVAVGPFQQSVGEAGSEFALGELPVFCMEGGVVVPDPSAVVRSMWSLSCTVGSPAGSAVARSCASSTMTIFRESDAVDPVDERKCE